MKRWYAFMGDDDPTDLAHYYRLDQPRPFCLCGDRICSVYMEDTGPQPTIPLSSNLQKYVRAALATEMMQPDTPYDAKKYVYLH